MAIVTLWKKKDLENVDIDVINMRLDSRDIFPSGMEEYLSQNGWHFNKRMCEWACSGMYKKDKAGNKTKVNTWNKDEVDALLTRTNITIENKIGYDYVFAANMCKADYLGSSVLDDVHVALFIKDYVDDGDGYPELPFTRFYSDCIGKGYPIPWEDLL